MILLDTQAEEDVRAKLVADARAAIEARGELLRHDDWGTRALAYPINRQAVAEYHLLQFHAGAASLLSDLDRSLRIADEALRFRIIKLRAGVPAAPDMSAGVSAQREPSADAVPAAAEPAREPTPQPTDDARAPADAQVAPAEPSGEPS